jgi:hypothetical protein
LLFLPFSVGAKMFCVGGTGLLALLFQKIKKSVTKFATDHLCSHMTADAMPHRKPFGFSPKGNSHPLVLNA